MNNRGMAIVSGPTAFSIIAANRAEIFERVKLAYREFGQGLAKNPNSLFLTFDRADRPRDRIISLPAYCGGDSPVAGMKWISSFPGNIDVGLPRASAVIVLNDLETGFPFACLEGSHISSARTAASAALGAEILFNGDKSASSVGFVGAGVISRSIYDFLIAEGWSFEHIRVFDTDSRRLSGFVASLPGQGQVVAEANCDDLIASSELVVFATTAITPHVSTREAFAHNPRVLHISLRDIDPNIILQSYNVVDDAVHCLRANTSVHLAAQVDTSWSVNGNIYDWLDVGKINSHEIPRTCPAIYSPFGLGVLDVAVANYVFHKAMDGGNILDVDDFFEGTQ